MPGLRRLALFLLAAGVSYGSYRMLVRPRRTATLFEAENTAAGLAATLAEAVAAPGAGMREGESRALADDLEKTRERLTALRGILSRSGEAEAVLHSLPVLAAEAGVEFGRFAPEPEYRLDGYTARAVSVVAEGEFFGFVHFFDRVSALPQLVLIEELELRASAGGRLASRLVAVTMRPSEPRNSEAGAASEAAGR